MATVPSNPSKEPSDSPVKAAAFSTAAAIFATDPYPPAFQAWTGGFLPVSWHHYWQRLRRFVVAGRGGEGDLTVGGFCPSCCTLRHGTFAFKLGQNNLCSLVPFIQKLELPMPVAFNPFCYWWGNGAVMVKQVGQDGRASSPVAALLLTPLLMERTHTNARQGEKLRWNPERYINKLQRSGPKVTQAHLPC